MIICLDLLHETNDEINVLLFYKSRNQKWIIFREINFTKK